MTKIYKITEMNTAQLAFAKLLYGVEPVLNYETGTLEVRIPDQAILRRVGIAFVA